MEPVTAVIVVSKLIGLGMKSWSALDNSEINKDDVDALRTLLDTGTSLSGMRKPAPPSAAATHLALISRAFGRAVGRHFKFHGKSMPGGKLGRLFDSEARGFQRQLEQRVEQARLRIQPLGNAPKSEASHVDDLTGSPLATPYYRALWAAFTQSQPTVVDDDPAPLLVASATTRSDFERYFLLAYLEEIASPAGSALRDYLEGLKSYRTELVQELLIADLATWGDRHVFGNTPREQWSESGSERERNAEDLPFLPLDALYVEPEAVVRDPEGKEASPEPLLALLDRLTRRDAAEKVIVVVADFGNGKSLSARMAARRWAQRYREAVTPSLDSTIPVYVRCADDFPHERIDLDATVQMAWKRQATSFGASLSDNDAALAWPSAQQQLTCLLDGLDEVSLGELHTKTLFQKLRGKTTSRHRFVVFSRPGAVPSWRELGKDVVVVRVQPFGDDQIQQWLTAWNQLRPASAALTLEALAQRSLHDLARTPILLFMVAFTWEAHTRSSEPPSRAEIYEHFFQQLAAGKAEADRERHGPIATASEQLRSALQNAGLLEAQATLADAMLWLMGRVAWEAYRLEQQKPAEALTKRHLDNLLQDGDLKLPAAAADVVRIGVVLAMQADLHSANHVMLFGHQSFREFLVGRHWAVHLLRLVRGSEREWDRQTRRLLGGRLLGDQDRSFPFLMQIVHAPNAARSATSPLTWTAQDRATLGRWAQEVFADEQQDFAMNSSGPSTALREDRRAVLREAALAIGSMIEGGRGIQTSHPTNLLSMLAWFWGAQRHPKLIARGAQLAGSRLMYAQLNNADLRNADLRKGLLVNAILAGSDLSGADLTWSVLTGCRLDNVDFSGANLSGCYLNWTFLFGADFSNANLSGAVLTGADLRGADLRTAKLEGAIFVSDGITTVHDRSTLWPKGFDVAAAFKL